MQTITLTAHEQREWSRCAQAMYARQRNDLGHLLSIGSALVTLPIQQYDRAAAAYRAWLVFDEPKAEALADAQDNEDEPVEYLDAKGITMLRTESVKQFIRHPYAWPGGYPCFATCRDGGCLCHKCTKANAKQIIRDTRQNDRHSGWNVAGIDINYEDASLYCDHCSQRIESAYAEPEEA